MKHVFVYAVIFFAMITAIETSSAQIADHFLFTEDARARLKLVPEADTVQRIKLLNNIAFSEQNEDSKEARQAAQQLVTAFRRGHDEPVVEAYRWSLRVMDIREWGWWAKATRDPKGNTRIAVDSLSVLLAQNPRNFIIRFIRANIAIEAARHIPELFDIAREDLEYIEQHLVFRDAGALFFLDLDWAKYFYWRAEKADKKKKQLFLLFAQYHINEAARWAVYSYYQEEIAGWHERVTKKKPEIKIWNKEVLKFVEEHD